MEPLATSRRLDLGCGDANRPGFVGMDRFFLPGVDVVSSFDEQPLPFRDGSFDLVVAVHSLEHAADVMSVLREVWRVARPGAQVVVNGPYGAQALNFANPYHKAIFNEHSPRFWTHAPESRIDPAEYVHPPQGSLFGLSRTDHSDPGFDLRCMRMEFFYFEEYWHLSPEEQRAARRKYLDVCDQILYHLLVMKPPLTEEDARKWEMDYWLPPHLDARRAAAAARAAALGRGSV